MQPNFTLKKLGFVSLRVFALAMLIGLTAQSSFSQAKPTREKVTPQQQAEREAQKLERYNARALAAKADNDAGLPNQIIQNQTPRTEAVCQTYNGALLPGDLTMPDRLNRGGAEAGNCTTPYTLAAPFGGLGYFYDTYTYTNTTGLTQCGTFNLTTTDVTNANIAFGLWDGSFNPLSLPTNSIAHPGLSTGTPAGPLQLQKTINAGQTIVIVVWSANPSSGASGTAANYQVTVEFPLCSSAPCTGTPAPGNTLSTATTACPGINFTLSLQNATAGAGVTYQWQSGPSMTGPWTPIAGATSPSLVRNHTAATYYRCNVTCSGNTGSSTPVLVALTPPSGCYCIPPPVDCTDNDEIIRVRISTLDNASGCSAGPPAGYGDYTNTVAAPNVQAGAPNTITVDYKTLWSKSGAVWIDYDHSGSFEANEYTSTGSGAGTVAQLIADINIPPSALSGITRMRVRTRFGTGGFGNTQACTNPSAFGETEDYNVNILPCVPVTISSSPVNRTIQCSGNTTFTVTAAGTNPTYQWEYRPNSATVWQLVTNGGIYSGASTATLTLSDVPTTYNGYQYRAIVTGGCSAPDFTSTATLTVGPLIAVVSPASATICTGTIQKLSLTNAASPVTQTFTASAGLPIAITNNATGYKNSIPVALPAGSVISKVDVKFSIPDHTWAGDLSVVLQAPNNQVLNLDYQISGTGVGPTTGMVNTNISSAGTVALGTQTNLWTGTFKADAAVGPADAGPTTLPAPSTATWSSLYTVPSGNWTLGVRDSFAGDDGTLTAWSITITYGAAATGVWTGQANTMWLDPLATIPYVPGSLQNTIYVNPTSSTNYSVVYSTATPCTSPATVVPVTVVNPVGAIVAPANTAVCVGGTTSFTSTAAGGPVTRQWQVSVDGGVTWSNISGQTGSTLTLSNVTQLMNNNRYRANYTAAPCLGSTASAAATLKVNKLPIVAITAPDLTLTPPSNGNTVVTATSDTAAAANGWAWTLNGSPISGTTNTQGVGIDQIGTYQATVTDKNGCMGSSNLLVIGSEPSDRLWIYPNPTDGQFQVRYYFQSSTVNESRIVSIFNAIGQLVTTKKFFLPFGTAPYLRMDFDLTAMAPGTYVVKVAHEYTGKVVSGLVVVQ